MPTGVFVRTPEYREKQRKAALGKNTWTKGKKLAQETIEKMRIANKGKHKYWKGKKFSLEHREKIGAAHRGNKSHHWKGGREGLRGSLRGSYVYGIWRKAVLDRDNYTCQWCGQWGGHLNVDHIKPFSILLDEMRIKSVEEAFKSDLFDVKNGRTLCINCHKKTSSYLCGNKTYQLDLL